MQDKDSDILFEMYQKMYEAPVGPGSAWDDDVDIDPSQSKRLGTSTYGELPEDTVRAIIQNIKAFLQEHENGIYPGSMDDLKVEIKVIIQDTAEGVNATKATYASRVIKNELKRLNIIDDSNLPDQVEIKNVDNIDEIGDEIEDTLDGGGDKPVAKNAPIFLSAEYTVDRDDLPMSASQEAKDAHEALLQAGMAFNKHTGKDMIKATGLAYSEAKDILGELVELGVIERPDQVDDDEDRIVDVGGEKSDEDYSRAVSGEYEKLRRNISGGEAMTMRPDDF